MRRFGFGALAGKVALIRPRMKTDRPSTKADQNLQSLTSDSLLADKRAKAAKGKARLAKKKLKEAKQAWKSARDQYKAAKKMARKADKACRSVRKALKALIDNTAKAKKKRGKESPSPHPKPRRASKSPRLAATQLNKSGIGNGQPAPELGG
jgi:hypothetical protein